MELSTYVFGPSLELGPCEQLPSHARRLPTALAHEEHFGTLLMRNSETLLRALFGRPGIFLWSDRHGYCGGFDHAWLLDDGTDLAIEVKNAQPAMLDCYFRRRDGSPKLWQDVADLREMLFTQPDLQHRASHGRDVLRRLELAHFCAFHQRKSLRRVLGEHPNRQSGREYETIDVDSIVADTAAAWGATVDDILAAFHAGHEGRWEHFTSVEEQAFQLCGDGTPWQDGSGSDLLGGCRVQVVIAAPRIDDGMFHEAFQRWMGRAMLPNEAAHFSFLQWTLYTDGACGGWLEVGRSQVSGAKP